MADEQGAIPEALERLFDQAFTDGIAAGKSDDESILAGSSGVYARSALAIVAADRLTDTGEEERRAICEYLVACGDEADRQRAKCGGNTEMMQACALEAKAYRNAARMIAAQDHSSYRAALATHKTADAGAIEPDIELIEKLGSGDYETRYFRESLLGAARRLRAFFRNQSDAGEPL